jgi:hypothetical protein
MKVFCPNCQQAMTIPDTDAGKSVECGSCKHLFTAPRLFAASPIEAPPVPPPPPPPAPSFPPPEAPIAPTSSPVSPDVSKHQASIPLNPNVCEWTVLAAFLVALILSFFNWVGSYPAGYAAYTQNAWQALFADFSVDPVSEKVMNLEAGIAERLRSSWWMLPYLVFLLLGVVAAWSNAWKKLSRRPLPALVERYWKYRPAIVAGCAGATLFCVLAQMAIGYGLPRALESRVEGQYAEERRQAKTPEEIQQVEMKMAMEQGGYRLRTTTWLTLTVIAHILAALAIVGETLLIQRGAKPPPRVGVMW